MLQSQITSTTSNTIWAPITEDAFMQGVRMLFERSGRKAGNFRQYDQPQRPNSRAQSTVPVEMESQLVHDFAFLAAYEQGARTVSAASMDHIGDTLIVNVALNEGIPDRIRHQLDSTCAIIQNCARKEIGPDSCINALLDAVVRLDQMKIIARLRNRRWKPIGSNQAGSPSLCDSLHIMMNALRAANPTLDTCLALVDANIKRLSELDRAVELATDLGIHGPLKAVVALAGKLVDSNTPLEEFIGTEGIRITDADMKTVKALDKLGNYSRICQRLSRVATKARFRHLFATLKLNYIDSYPRQLVGGGYRYVHAEVQIAIYHRLNMTLDQPRVIGTSKAACYLCDLFLSFHNELTVSASHGILYEGWTIPDLVQYSEDDRHNLKSIISKMRRRLLKSRSNVPRNAHFPVQSGIFAPVYVPSVTATASSISIDTIREELQTCPLAQVDTENSRTRHNRALCSVVSRGESEQSQVRSLSPRRPTGVSVIPQPSFDDKRSPNSEGSVSIDSFSRVPQEDAPHYEPQHVIKANRAFKIPLQHEPSIATDTPARTHHGESSIAQQPTCNEPALHPLTDTESIHKRIRPLSSHEPTMKPKKRKKGRHKRVHKSSGRSHKRVHTSERKSDRHHQKHRRRKRQQSKSSMPLLSRLSKLLREASCGLFCVQQRAKKGSSSRRKY